MVYKNRSITIDKYKKIQLKIMHELCYGSRMEMSAAEQIRNAESEIQIDNIMAKVRKDCG